MNEYTEQILKALNENNLGLGKLGQIYHKNQAEQNIMSKYAQQHNIKQNGIDHYFHRKATAEAAQYGVPIGAAMLSLGNFKEYKDFLRDTYKYAAKNITFTDTRPEMLSKLAEGMVRAGYESKKDLQNDGIGYIIGLNSKTDVTKNPELNRYNSKSVNMLLQALGGNK